jgi:hypothetical protein
MGGYAKILTNPTCDSGHTNFENHIPKPFVSSRIMDSFFQPHWTWLWCLYGLIWSCSCLQFMHTYPAVSVGGVGSRNPGSQTSSAINSSIFYAGSRWASKSMSAWDTELLLLNKTYKKFHFYLSQIGSRETFFFKWWVWFWTQGSCLQNRHSTTWVITPVHFASVILKMGFWELFARLTLNYSPLYLRLSST